MNLTPEQREQVAAELKRFAADLQLSDAQKQQLHDALADGRVKVAEYVKTHPNVTKADMVKEVTSHRDQIRQRVVNFLTPDQLRKWDTEISKAKEFLGHNFAA